MSSWSSSLRSCTAEEDFIGSNLVSLHGILLRISAALALESLTWETELLRFLKPLVPLRLLLLPLVLLSVVPLLAAIWVDMLPLFSALLRRVVELVVEKAPHPPPASRCFGEEDGAYF